MHFWKKFFFRKKNFFYQACRLLSRCFNFFLLTGVKSDGAQILYVRVIDLNGLQEVYVDFLPRGHGGADTKSGQNHLFLRRVKKLTWPQNSKILIFLKTLNLLFFIFRVIALCKFLDL